VSELASLNNLQTSQQFMNSGSQEYAKREIRTGAH